MIWEKLNQALIFTGLKADTYEDVMRQAGNAFIREGYGKESYVQALIEREREFPTGLNVDGYGVAIPHTAVEHVNKSGIGIAILKNPVTFREMGADEEDTVEVRIVFMLAVVEPNQHIEELQQILAVLQDKAVLGVLLQAESKEEIIRIIREKENSL